MPLLRPAVVADRPFLLDLTTRLADFPLPPRRTHETIAGADHSILLAALTRPTATELVLVAEDPQAGQGYGAQPGAAARGR